MTARDLRTAEVRLLAIAVVLAVSAMSAVGFLADRFQASLEREAARALGGQLIVHSDRMPADAYGALARTSGVSTAMTVVFPSMATVNRPVLPDENGSTLVSVKAVDEGYPLLGEIQLAHTSGASRRSRHLAHAEVWIEQPLADTLSVKTGDTLKLGDADFQIGAILLAEPDRGLAFVNIAPRIMIRLDDLPSTHLDQPGARLSYRLLVNGEPSKVAAYRTLIEPLLVHGQRLESIVSSEARERPEMAQTLDRARSFLMLATLQTSLVTGIAIALAARRFMRQRLNTCALMRCMGASQANITAMFALEFLLIAMVASIAGLLFGYGIHHALLSLISTLVDAELPTPSWRPIVHGLAFGIALLMAFAMAPIAGLQNVPAMKVLRPDQAGVVKAMTVWAFLGPACLAVLVLWQGQAMAMTAYALGGFLLASCGIAVISYAAVSGARWVCSRYAVTSIPLRLAIAGLARRSSSTVTQILAVSLGLFSLMLTQLISTDLVASWKSALGPDTPNRFVVNIQPDQRVRFEQLIQAQGMPKALTLPMVRGRLSTINGEAVQPDKFEQRTRRLLDREFNLSYMDRAPAHNVITSGQWWSGDESGISVEQGLADQLHLKVGDRLGFEIAGKFVEAPIASLRKVQWTSMQINFFVIFSPSLLADAEQTFISTLHVPHGLHPENSLIREMNNLTIVDTEAAVAQLQLVLTQLVNVVRVLSLFAVIAGFLVLGVVSASARDERLHEVALLRALGATRATLSVALWTETAFVGSLSGMLAAMSANILANLLGAFMFDLPWAWRPASFAVAILAAVVLAWLGGWWGTRQVTRQSPLLSLREI